MSILIRGAGIAGLVLAHELAQAGRKVVIAEVATAPGLGASHYAGGMLAPFCEGETASADLVRLGAEAIGWWKRALPAEVTHAGTLVVAPARDAGELRRFASRTTNHVWLNAERVAEKEPDLAGRFSQALFFAEEAHLDPRRVMAALAVKLEAMGVELRLGEDASEQVETAFEAVIDCTGRLALGNATDLRGVRGEMLVVETPEVTLDRPVRLLHPRIPLYIVPRSASRFMIGATMIESEDDGPASVRSVMELLNAAYALHPAFAEARLIETGTGIRPAYPNNFPRFSRQSANRYRLNGFYRHGFLLAPALARQAVRELGGTA